MTIERKDAKMLRAYSRLGKWNRELSARLVSWPLIEIPDMSDDVTWQRHYRRLRYKNDPIKCIVPRTLAEVLGKLSSRTKFLFPKFGWVSNITDLIYQHRFSAAYIDASSPVGTTTVYFYVNESTFAKITARDFSLTKNLIISNVNSTVVNPAINTRDWTALIDSYIAKYIELLIFLDYIECSDYYAVSVTPVTPKALPKVQGSSPRVVGKSKTTTPTHAGPRIIYLNRLPAPSNADTYASFAGSPLTHGHDKRGHYRTLTHHRYRNHPMYMVPNGVYVKACWVGPTSCIYQGNIYTLIKTA